MAAALTVTACMAEDDPPPPPEDDPPPPSESPEPQEDVLGAQGISAAHPLAVEAGERVLSEGGNAVDAAVAAAFAVSVVEPFASGVGGGGSALIAGTEGEPAYYDYREVVAQDGQIPDSGTGVPGFVAGMETMHEEHGTLDWAELLAPAEELAAEGFEVSEFLDQRMREDFGPDAVENLDHYSPGGEPLSAGDELVQEDLAETLSALREDPSSFYTGELADELAEAEGIDAGSLASYEVMSTEPVSGEFGDHEVVSAAPALPGAAVIQLLQVAESQGAGEAEPGAAEYIRAVSEAWELAEETALTELGDPFFVENPVDELTDPEVNAQLDGTQAVPLGEGDSGGSPNTTHITAVDKDGLMVSMTNTITDFWGAGEMIGGFFLNNQLTRFEAIDSPANQPEPGRRSVSWAAPSMVLDGEGRPILGIGTPGGPQIPNILATVLIQWGLQDAELEEALATPRFRFDSGDDLLEIEELPSGTEREALEDLGWELEESPPEWAVFGSVQALEVDYGTGEVAGADDPRREGAHTVVESGGADDGPQDDDVDEVPNPD